MDIASLIISIAALLFSGYVYIAHDRKLKQQQKILNAYQIEAMEKDKTEQKKAEVRVSLTNKQFSNSYSYWSGIMVIKNYGKAVAHHVRIDKWGKRDFRGFENFTCLQLLPQETQEVPVTWLMHDCGELQVTVFWNDEYSKNRENKQILNL